MNLIKISILLVAFFVVACGGAEKNVATSNAAPAEKTAKNINESPSPIKDLQAEVSEVTNTVAKESANTETVLKEKVASNAPTIAEATTAPIEKITNKAKDAVSLSMDEAKNKGNDIVEAVKETSQTATTAVKKTENVVIKGAEEIKEASKSPIQATTPQVVEKTKEAVVEKTAAVTAATAAAAVKEKASPKPSIVDHSIWDQLLRKHVSASGKVNYQAIKADPSSLDAYLKILSDNPINKEWSRNQKMAYWINAYNAYTVKLIVDNYPVKSILDLHGGKAWDHSWIKLGDKTYTLNDIEHKILRPQFKDPRIHFAVNCAATSCPPILNRAWTAENLNKTLELQTRKFINNASYNSIGGDVAVSKIFEWYKEDFGELKAYLNKYATKPIAAGTSIDFKEYDWALNKQ